MIKNKKMFSFGGWDEEAWDESDP